MKKMCVFIVAAALCLSLPLNVSAGKACNTKTGPVLDKFSGVQATAEEISQSKAKGTHISGDNLVNIVKPTGQVTPAATSIQID